MSSSDHSIRQNSSPFEYTKRPRQKRRPANERGFPSPAALRDLAKTYLECQARLWPELVGTSLLPAMTDEVIRQFAKEFRDRFLTRSIALRAPSGSGRVRHFAASYVRYSCDNSNPRSLDQQLKLQLERAAVDERFIPWCYVFGDAAVSGTTSSRRGYEMAKELVTAPDQAIDTLDIDEIGRASRDMIDSQAGAPDRRLPQAARWRFRRLRH